MKVNILLEEKAVFLILNLGRFHVSNNTPFIFTFFYLFLYCDICIIMVKATHLRTQDTLSWSTVLPLNRNVLDCYMKIAYSLHIFVGYYSAVPNKHRDLNKCRGRKVWVKRINLGVLINIGVPSNTTVTEIWLWRAEVVQRRVGDIYLKKLFQLKWSQKRFQKKHFITWFNFFFSNNLLCFWI